MESQTEGSNIFQDFADAVTNMSNLICFLTTVWLSTADAQFDTFASAGQIFVNFATNEVAAAKLPVQELVFDVVFSHCQMVKQILHVDREAYEENEPDLSQLTLNYYSEAENATYNLTEAAALIPEAAWFDPDRNLYIFMHGFTDDPSEEGFQTINDALMSRGKVNVLGLDASSLIRWLYLRSSTFVTFIGERLGEVLVSLVNVGLDPGSIHLMGHSLGAHIAGFAGKTFYNTTGHKISRISGLDPAGPCFADLPEDQSLNINDADFVDVCHTNAGLLGIDRQVGHVNFWPNGGSLQPNCLLLTCSHCRSWEFYAESVTNPQAFIGASCADWDEFRDGACNYTDTSPMGFWCKPGTTGTYFLQTGGESPYGRGESGLEFVNNEGIVRNTLTNILR